MATHRDLLRINNLHLLVANRWSVIYTTPELVIGFASAHGVHGQRPGYNWLFFTIEGGDLGLWESWDVIVA